MNNVIVTGAEAARMRPRPNTAVLGPTGIGKTSLVWTLPPEETLFLDYEAGDLAIKGWPGDRLNVLQVANNLSVHPWELTRAIACLIAGPDITDQDGPYGKAAYERYSKVVDPRMFDKYGILFNDSITQVSRWSFEYTSRYDPASFSEKTGKPDVRGTYGAHGRQMVKWLTVLQHQSKRLDGKAKSIIVVGILDPDKDDLGRITGWSPQIVGGMAGRELPGIFDEVISMISMPGADGKGEHRAFICQTINPFLVPAKDRSRALDMIEPADLMHVMKKIENFSSGAKPDHARTLPPAASTPAQAVASGPANPSQFVAPFVPPAQPGPVAPARTSAQGAAGPVRNQVEDIPLSLRR